MKKIFLILLTAMFLTTTSFAQTFSDVPNGHWAKGSIEKMVEAGIISGYTDGTFRPSAELSRMHGLILVARMAGLTSNATTARQYANTYSSTLSKYSTQYKTEIAYLIGTGILKTDELDDFVSDAKINKGLTRQEMAMLVTRLLGKDNEATSKSLIILSFKDSSSIDAKYKPYVSYVSSNSYMNGIDKNNFAPKMILTRAHAASALQRIQKDVNVKPSTSTNPSTSSKPTSFLTGTITKIDTSLKSVWIKDSDGDTEEYSYDSKTEFYVNSTAKTASAMSKNAKVTVTIVDDEYISIMNISDGANIETSTLTGTISSFSTSAKTVTIKKGSKTYTYKYDTNTKFTLNGSSSTYSKALVKNYEITATIEDDSYIATAKVKKPVEEIIGEIVEADKGDGYIIIEDEDGDEYILMDDYLEEYDEDDEDYIYDDDTDFYYNGSSKTYSAISSNSYLYNEGYYVRVVLDDDDYAEEIYVGSSKSKVEEDEEDDEDVTEIIGEIVEADKGDGYIIIEDEDGDEYILMDDYLEEYDEDDEDYIYDDDTDFYYNGSSKTYSAISSNSYLYNEGYYVRVVLDDDDYAEEIYVGSSKSKVEEDDEDITEIIGEIVEADKGDGYIIIEDEDGDEYILMDDYVEEYDDDDEDYIYDDDTTYYYNGSSKAYSYVSSTSCLYKEGYYVKIILDADYIEKLYIGSSKSKVTSSGSSNDISNGYVSGYILEFDDEVIILEDDDGEEYEIFIDENCIIIEADSEDPEYDLEYYEDEADDMLDEDDKVVVFVYKDSGDYYTNLVILLD